MPLGQFLRIQRGLDGAVLSAALALCGFFPVLVIIRLGDRNSGSRAIPSFTARTIGPSWNGLMNTPASSIAAVITSMLPARGRLRRLGYSRLSLACALLARYYPREGARHDASKDLGGFLAGCGIPVGGVAGIKVMAEAIGVASDPALALAEFIEPDRQRDLW